MWGRRPPSAEESELVREAEAFLLGTYVAQLVSEGWLVPDWAWLNGVAHGDIDRLRALAGGAGIMAHTYGTTRVWQQVEAYLAQEVLTRCGPDQLPGVQSSMLVPLELELANAAATEGMLPMDLVHRVMSALEGHHTSR
jgi:hypothetical protein